ncbi:TPA: phage virion morphogenesis protein, partial [Escherichia coli]|nr:phage virion morphogenesis protein [Escherichia coli]EEZ2317520.1 phage virion morphogenesis protein [Escherichia coli]EEZ3334317.1 phage virion morphogenesis protein [Escherichia coli]EIG9882461.1 phage virion morphogenesis protein [Escherichia coli]EII7652330.1 phage virion morphogenesis protein [Escherichia coli]
AIGARPYMGFDQVAEQEIMDEIRKRFKKATETP